MKVQQRKAISPLIATIILIAITVIGGALVYTIFLSTASASGSGPSIQLSGITLSASNGLTINVKDTSSSPLSGTSNITISGGVLTSTEISDSFVFSPAISSLSAGQTEVLGAPATAYLVPVTVGSPYTITFIAGSGGSSASFTYTVTATS